MSATKGYAAQSKLENVKPEFATVEPVRAQQNALSVNAHAWVRLVASDAVEANSTTQVINATAHVAQKGDVIRLTSGALSGTEVKVHEVAANTITLVEQLASAPVAAVTFDILRHKYPLVAADGSISVSTTPGPLQFVYNSTDTEVEEDAGTPANSRPLPVKLLNGSGDEAGTASDPVRVDPTGTTAQPITDNGGSITVDGTVAATQSGVWNVGLTGTVPLPTGAATEATLASVLADTATIDSGVASIDGKTPALVSGRVPVDGSGVTQPVSAASLPLPTGAATEATLASIDGNIVTCDTGAVTISAALPAGNNNIGDVDVASLPSIPAGTNNIGDVDVLSLPAIPAGTNRIGSVDVNLDVVDFLDTNPVLNAASTNIPASASNPLEVVASLAADVKKIRVNDTTGLFIGVYTGAALSEVLQAVIGPGLDGHIEVQMASGQRVSLRHMSNSVINLGELCIQFLG